MLTTPQTCNVCHNHELELLFDSGSGSTSLSSLCTLHQVPTKLYYCHDCGHIQTQEVLNSGEFYDLEYKISLDSQTEDQLYKLDHGQKIFRCQHQAKIVEQLFNLQPQAKILDYGCAKGLTTRHLQKTRPDVNWHLFDISKMYSPFWQQFLPESHTSTYNIPADWLGQMDLVLSFFAAEHVSDLSNYLGQMSDTLKPGGWMMFTVPDWQTNPADLLVVDHVNHFTNSSLAVLLHKLGWQHISINNHLYQAGITITAQKSLTDQSTNVGVNRRFDGTEDLECYITHAYLTATYKKCLSTVSSWQVNRDKIKSQEQNLTPTDQVAIYGSGFYGAYIASCLKDLSRVFCFLDANPHQQQKTLFGKPILAPEKLPPNITQVLVGLNPQIAQSALSNSPVMQFPGRQFTFLDKAKAA